MRALLDKNGRIILLIIFTMLIPIFIPFHVQAEDKSEQGRVVTVAYPIVEGYSMKDENGKRSGVFYDFLVEIAKYTGWKYEFIEGKVEELSNGLMEGSISIMGCTYYRDYMEETVLYPDYDMGDNYALLLADNQDERIQAYDLNTLNGMKIGVFDKAYDKIEKLEQFLDFHQISCELVYFDTSESYAKSLDEKKVDMLLGSDIHKKDKHKVAARFVSEPIYIVVSKGDSDLLDQMNEALKKVYGANPGIADSLYSSYFPEVYKNAFFIDSEDEKYITGNKIVRVAMMESRYPLNYEYQENEKGISRDILNYISDKTGFIFEYVYTDTYMEAIQLVQSGQADVVGYFLEDDEAAVSMGMIATESYTELDEIIIKNKRADGNSDDLRLAMPKGRSIPSNIDFSEIIYYSTYEECLKKINSNKADVTYIPFAFAEDIFQRNYYSELVILPVNDKKLKVSFAMPENSHSQLYYIFSKAINSMDETQQAHIVSDNQIFVSDNKVTLRSIIYSNPVLLIFLILLFVVTISSIVMIRWKYRLKSELMAGELKQMGIASAAKLDFLSRMSHELRTPMNAIIGLTKLAKLSGEATPSLEDKLKKIDVSSQYLLCLLNDILDMSKIESSKMKIITQPFMIKDLVCDLEYMMRIQADEKELNFEVICDTGDSVYIADMLRIKQVLTNLLSNALKFTPKGGTVKMQVHEKEEAGDFAMVSFSVEDTGIGIRKEDLKKIFGVFEQITESGASTKGTGLGLAISSNLVRLMGGELQVESKEGVGSRFFFTLIFPYGYFSEQQIVKAVVQLEGKDDDVLKGMRILLAEDNELNAEITIALLEQKEMVVEHVINGQEALDIYIGRPPGYYDAILMDIQMPVMNGFTATEKIRASGKRGALEIPIIAMTANTFQEDRDQATACGMTDFVPKPFKIEELYDIIIRSKS